MSIFNSVVQKVSSNSCGSGALELEQTGAPTFSDAQAESGYTGSIFYKIYSSSTQWEIGEGTVSGNILTRNNVLSSSNGGNPIDIPCTPCSESCYVVQGMDNPNAPTISKGDTEPTNPNDNDTWIDTTCPNWYKEKRWCAIIGKWACVNAYDPNIEDCEAEICVAGIVPAGVVDNVNTTYTLPEIPSRITAVYYGSGTPRSYLWDGVSNQVITGTPPCDCENVVIDYCYTTTDCPPEIEGDICEAFTLNTSDTVITLTNPALDRTAQVSVDGIRQGQDVDYTISSNTITLINPINHDATEVVICYQY